VANAANPALTIRENCKTTTASFKRAAAPDYVLHLNLYAGNTKEDEVAIRFTNQATDQFDPNYDAINMAGGRGDIASRSSNNIMLMVDSRPMPTATTSIPLQITSPTNAQYRIKVEGVNSFNGEYQLYLHDFRLHTYERLVDGNDISIIDSLSNNRFEIVAVPTVTGIDPSNSTIVSIYPNPANDKIQVTGIVDGKPYTILNAIGQVVKTGSLTNQTIGLEGLGQGVYSLKVEGHAVVKFVKE
jgi:hypothetical protein